MPVNRQTIHPRDEAHWHELRAQDLTSTDIPALFGMSPHKTLFELWHEKQSGQREPIEDSERMEAGRELEEGIARIVCRRRNWLSRPMKEYMRLRDERLGSSFDCRVLNNDVPATAETAMLVGSGQACFDSDADAILEIKNVDWRVFKNGWIVDNDYIEAPAHIELQVQHQMLVSGLRKAYIGVLVGGNDVRILERDADDAVHRAIRTEAAAFWQTIAMNQPPDPVMPDDADAVIRLYQYAAPGKLLDARGDQEIASLLRQLKNRRTEEREMKEQGDVLKATILQRIGDTEKVIADEGLSLSAVMVAPSRGTLVTPEMVGTYVGGREGYRLCRVSQKKAK